MPENSPNQPMVSIVVPVYKAERFLDECIRSIVGQTYSNLEIILVDDASPDQCPRICDEWAERDERVSVIHLDNGKGASGARNVGLDHCTGDYVMFVDSDDLLKTDAVRYSVKQVLVGDYDLVIFGKHYIDEYGNVSRTILTILIFNGSLHTCCLKAFCCGHTALDLFHVGIISFRFRFIYDVWVKSPRL